MITSRNRQNSHQNRNLPKGPSPFVYLPIRCCWTASTKPPRRRRRTPPPLKIVEAGPNCAARCGEKPVLGRGGHNARPLWLVERGRGGRARRRKRSDFGRRRFASVAGETPAEPGAAPGVANATPRRDNARRRVSPRMAREPTDKVAVARDAGAADKAERSRKCHARLDSTHPCQSIAFGDSLRSATIIFDFFCSLSRAVPFLPVFVRGKEDEG